jgi:hypothetical protein
MIIITSGTNVSVTVKDSDLMAGKKRFYAFYMNGYYDPENGFKPCFDKPGATPRRRLHEKFEAEYNGILKEADTMFEKVKGLYQKRMSEAAAKQPAPTPVPAPAPAQQGGGLGTQLEQMLMASIAEMSVGKVIEAAKPKLEKHIIETFGMMPQVHKIETPAGVTEITGVVHERFDTVLKLVNADIPVFLSGPAGTGKNVICKQVAKALGLEFYFSNAVTQEYKISGFIDANGKFHETQFYQAFTKGGVFMLDEMDASVPEVLVMLNAAIANRYFDFPTGRVEAHKDFRLIAAGNTFGTGADIEYTGRYQLDAASLDRFALLEINYSPAIEKALAQGDIELVDFVHAFRKATQSAGMKVLATYRSIERIKKLDGMMDAREAVQICLVKGMPKDDLSVIVSSIRSELNSANKYFVGMKQLAKAE